MILELNMSIIKNVLRYPLQLEGTHIKNTHTL
jgi:hypothetical protein